MHALFQYMSIEPHQFPYIYCLCIYVKSASFAVFEFNFYDSKIWIEWLKTEESLVMCKHGLYISLSYVKSLRASTRSLRSQLSPVCCCFELLESRESQCPCVFFLTLGRGYLSWAMSGQGFLCGIHDISGPGTLRNFIRNWPCV